MSGRRSVDGVMKRARCGSGGGGGERVNGVGKGRSEG